MEVIPAGQPTAHSTVLSYPMYGDSNALCTYGSFWIVVVITFGLHPVKHDGNTHNPAFCSYLSWQLFVMAAHDQLCALCGSNVICACDRGRTVADISNALCPEKKLQYHVHAVYNAKRLICNSWQCLSCWVVQCA